MVGWYDKEKLQRGVKDQGLEFMLKARKRIFVEQEYKINRNAGQKRDAQKALDFN